MTIDDQIKFIQNKLLGYQPASWSEADIALNAILKTLKEVKQAQANKDDSFEFTTNDLDNPESI